MTKQCHIKKIILALYVKVTHLYLEVGESDAEVLPLVNIPTALEENIQDRYGIEMDYTGTSLWKDIDVIVGTII